MNDKDTKKWTKEEMITTIANNDGIVKSLSA